MSEFGNYCKRFNGLTREVLERSLKREIAWYVRLQGAASVRKRARNKYTGDFTAKIAQLERLLDNVVSDELVLGTTEEEANIAREILRNMKGKSFHATN